jgi:hypothetical protein
MRPVQFLCGTRTNFYLFFQKRLITKTLCTSHYIHIFISKIKKIYLIHFLLWQTFNKTQ